MVFALPPRSQSDTAATLKRAATGLVVLLAGAALSMFAGCGSDDDAILDASSSEAPVSEDPGPIHVHGLGIDPADGALLIASHTGLFRVARGDQQAERIADRYQDTMAFTVIGPGHFLGSGHPDGREDLPPFLGLIESTDAGETWREVSLMGEVDFHLLVAAGDRVYGYGSEWEGEESIFLRSSDGGRTWERQAAQGPLVGLAVSPRDAAVLIASSATALYRSEDGGENWSTLPGPPGLLAWPQPDRLYLADASGAVKLSSDQGRAWRTVGRLPEAPAAFAADGGERLLAAGHDGTILQSSDGGSTFGVRFRL